MRGGRVRSYPVTSGLGDIFSDLLGGKTQRTDLGSQGGRSTNFTTGGTESAVEKKTGQFMVLISGATEGGRAVGASGMFLSAS